MPGRGDFLLFFSPRSLPCQTQLRAAFLPGIFCHLSALMPFMFFPLFLLLQGKQPLLLQPLRAAFCFALLLILLVLQLERLPRLCADPAILQLFFHLALHALGIALPFLRARHGRRTKARLKIIFARKLVCLMSFGSAPKVIFETDSRPSSTRSSTPTQNGASK